MDFEGVVTHKKFFFSGPDNNTVNCRNTLNNSNINFIKHGRYSLHITWNLNQGQYCGWGVGFVPSPGSDGLNVSQADSLVFWAKSSNPGGGDLFGIKVKDTLNSEIELSSQRYATLSQSTWTRIAIPVADFNNRINMGSLENISLDFSDANSTNGSIYVDDFKFIFNENQ